ncbi:hypothetical protein CCP2SC5_2600001 [Azospirillaceae bacterium]
MLGYADPVNISPSLSLWQSLVHPDDIESLHPTGIEHTGDDALDQFRSTYRMQRADGAWIWVEDIGRTLHALSSSSFSSALPPPHSTYGVAPHVGEAHIENAGGGGGPCRQIGIVTDVTRRRADENALKQAKIAAEDALSKLRSAQETLIESEKMAALGSLVAGIAHEINTPIGIALTGASFLAGETELLRKNLNDNILRKNDLIEFLNNAAESTQLIVLNSNRAADLVQSFKQVAVDQMSDDHRAFDLRDYIEETLRSLAPRIRKPGHKVVLDCSSGIIVDSYPGSLSQALTNLTMNALIHAFEPNHPGQISIAVSQPDIDTIDIVFADNGKGIPAEHRNHIFEPFFTTRRGMGGSGLGLHIVFNIITRRLHGRISVFSEIGQGTQFHLRFPRVSPVVAHGERENFASWRRPEAIKSLPVETNRSQ